MTKVRWSHLFDIINTIQTGYHAYILYYLRKHKDENAEELMRLINIDVYESYINDESYPLSFDLIACLNIDNKNNLSLKLFCETVSLSLKFKKIKFSDIPKVALDRLPNSKRKSLKVLCESTITLQNLSVDVKE